MWVHLMIPYHCIGYPVSKRKIILKAELGKMWNDVVVIYFKILSQH